MAVLPRPLHDGRRSGGDEGLGSRQGQKTECVFFLATEKCELIAPQWNHLRKEGGKSVNLTLGKEKPAVYSAVLQ